MKTKILPPPIVILDKRILYLIFVSVWMIELKTENVSEPVLTVHMSQTELLSLKDSPHVLPRYQESFERQILESVVT